jgi:xanthine dehydrogenase molybdopterin-binding subunit B
MMMDKDCMLALLLSTCILWHVLICVHHSFTLLPSAEIRRHGFFPQVIGVVVAETEAAARKAAKMVAIEYEDLPYVMSCEEV